MPEQTPPETVADLVQRIRGLTEQIRAMAEDLEGRDPPPPAKPARPPVERRHLRLVADERKAA